MGTDARVGGAVSVKVKHVIDRRYAVREASCSSLDIKE